jgi:hypothetical protein
MLQIIFFLYSHAAYIGNPLPQYRTEIPAGPLHGYTLWFNFVRVYFPLPVVLPAFMPCLDVLSMIVPHGDALESIEHIMLECPRWECHCRDFGTLALEFKDVVL